MTRGIVEAIEGHYSALALDALHQLGALNRLKAWRSHVELAADCGVDNAMLGPVLDFVVATTTLLESDGMGRIRLTSGETEHARIAHMLDQYVGGYGPALAGLATLLRERRWGEALVDPDRHAAAFAGDNDGGNPISETARIIIHLGTTGVVELGCGGAQTLCDIAGALPELTAVGIDSNPAVVAQARRLVQSRGFADRIRIVHGDALDALTGISLDGVQVVLASSFLNAFWREPGDASARLRRLSGLLPGRLLVVSDYYSHLGAGAGVDRGSPRTLIHDLVQAVSGQGVPPSSVDAWAGAYSGADAELLHVFEATGDGIDRFVHLVRLPDRPATARASGGPGHYADPPAPAARPNPEQC